MKVTHVDLGGLCKVQVVDSRPDPTQRVRIRDNAPHSHYALGRKDIHKELEAFRTICAMIGPREDWSVFEPFGGSGWHSALIQALVKPSSHFVVDIADDCVKSLARTFAGLNVVVIQKDGLDSLRDPRSYSWIHADYNIWTLDRMMDSEFRQPWLGLFNKAKSCITFTDTTPYRLQLKSVLAWYKEIVKWIPALTGWYVRHTVSWGPAAMHLLVPKYAFHSYQIIDEPMEVAVLKEEQL